MIPLRFSKIQKINLRLYQKNQNKKRGRANILTLSSLRSIGSMISCTFDPSCCSLTNKKPQSTYFFPQSLESQKPNFLTYCLERCTLHQYYGTHLVQEEQLPQTNLVVRNIVHNNYYHQNTYSIGIKWCEGTLKKCHRSNDKGR